jgi:hypothetical protein
MSRDVLSAGAVLKTARHPIVPHLVDVLVVAVVIGIRWNAQHCQAPGLEQTVDLPTWWWSLGSLSDWLLHPGPDAGLWAQNALALQDGTPLDHNRLPVYLGLLVVAGKGFGDLVFGGHMLNHCLSALVPIALYAFGKSTSGRPAGACAALLTALSPQLIASQRLFGVDPCVQLVLVCLAWATWWARNGSFKRIALAGAVAGIAASTHYLAALFVPLSMVALLTTDRRRGRRHRYLLSPLVLGAVAVGTVQVLLSPYSSISWSLVSTIYMEGLRSFSFVEGSDSLTTALWELALAAPFVVNSTLQGLLGSLRATFLPWTVLVLLFYIGLLGPGLNAGPHRLRDLRPGLWLLLFLGPLIPMEAVNAPLRYRLYALPFLFLVLARGVASTARILEAQVRKRAARWPSGAAEVVCTGLLILMAWNPMHRDWNLPRHPVQFVSPLLQRGLLERDIGRIVAEESRPLISRSSEIQFLSRATPCPMPTTPANTTEQILSRLLAQVSACGGSVTYVIEELHEQGLGDTTQQLADVLIKTHLDPIYEKRTGEYKASIYLVDSLFLASIESSAVTPAGSEF